MAKITIILKFAALQQCLTGLPDWKSEKERKSFHNLSISLSECAYRILLAHTIFFFAMSFFLYLISNRWTGWQRNVFFCFASQIIVNANKTKKNIKIKWNKKWRRFISSIKMVKMTFSFDLCHVIAFEVLKQYLTSYYCYYYIP